MYDLYTGFGLGCRASRVLLTAWLSDFGRPEAVWGVGFSVQGVQARV